jgi:short-subunit dehydrogenase
MPAIPFMIANKEGMIVLISSMAGLIGLSSSPSYSASKSAIKFFGDSLRAYLKKFNVKVSVVIPGYITTPMTEVNNFPMPFIISAERAAEIIVSGIEHNEGIIAFPKIMYFGLKLLSFLPYKFLDYINSKLPGKPSFDH